MQGISGVGPGPILSGSGQVTIGYKAPYLLALGTYMDSISVSVATDPGCTQTISGSPMMISSQYTITAVTSAHGPSVALSSNAISYLALPTDAGSPPQQLVYVRFQNLPTYSLEIATTATSNGLHSAVYSGPP
jgi:hypothetical protein